MMRVDEDRVRTQAVWLGGVSAGIGGMLALAPRRSGHLFGLAIGREPTGEFNAYDARTGELVWQHQTGSGLHSSPTTYSVKGKQYIAVPAGWGGWVKGFAPGALGVPRGDALVVYALP